MVRRRLPTMVQGWPQRDASERDASSRQPYSQNERLPADAASRQHMIPHERYFPDIVNRNHELTTERNSIEMPENGRISLNVHDIGRRQPPMAIDEALRSHCGIAAKQYFVAAIMDDGSPMTFFSPGQRLQDNTVRQFFNAPRFQQIMERIEMGADPGLEDPFGFEDHASSRMGSGRNHPIDSRRNSRVEDSDNQVRTSRKRPRARHQLYDDEEIPMVVASRRAIKISDSTTIWLFYEQRFKNCQQTACKTLAKAWVKAVEPKKQTNHPYTGSDEKAPDWWPKPWGPSKDEKVRHKEPDHLYKPERVNLLIHILRLIVEPHSKQHSELQKVHLNVAKLEEITFDSLSGFFAESAANARKKPYLKEIFKVARQEERFKSGEIDGSTEVFVMADDKIPETMGSDNDDGALVKEEDGQGMGRSSRPTVVPATPTAGPGTAANLQTGSFVNDLPMRPQFTHPIIAELPTQVHQFVEGTSLGVQGQASINPANGNMPMDIVQSPHDPSRRPSIFSDYATPGTSSSIVQSPHDPSRRPSVFSDYASPGTTSIYTQQWQPGSSTASPSPLYTYTTTQGNPQPASFVNPAVSLNQTSPFLGTNFEGSPRPNYDGASGSMFRASEMSQGPVAASEGYNYLQHDNRLRGITSMVDPNSRNHPADPNTRNHMSQ